MLNVHPIVARTLVLPSAPPPITQQELQRLRRKAWAEVAAIEASDNRYHRALQQQVQDNAAMGPQS